MDHSLTLLLGLPGQGVHLGIDPLSALFLGLLAVLVAAAAVAGQARSALFWGLVAAMALTLLAADAFTLILCFGLMNAAGWLALPRAAWLAGLASFSVSCLIAALFLPPGGLAFLLLLLAVGAVAALPRPVGAAASLTAEIALYVLLRVGFGVLAPVALPWCGVVLALLGTAALLAGALRALLETEMEPLLAGAALALFGQIGVALGIAFWARATGNAALAALAFQAALLAVVARVLLLPLLALGAGAVRQATGTTSLDWLGGLLRGMPRLGLLMLVGAAGMAALPLGPGFPGLFLLLHAVIAGAAAGGVAGGLGFLVLLAGLGLGVAMLGFAALRLIGIGFLGRPRSLRAAAAEEAPARTLRAMALLAFLCGAVALLPGLLLAALRPVLTLLAPASPALPLRYAPLPLALLMLAAGGVAWLALRRFAPRGAREARPWNGGFGKPPIWLPFGDPLTQASGTGFADPVRVLLAPYAAPAKTLRAGLRRIPIRWRQLATRRRVGLQHYLTAALAVLVAGLLAFALGH